ncbi:hypothetical protein FSARC_5918 [Fusarium sarcochroum]|uniref:Xylanolytic transcriptional activator regulatory domain-containing protein n=1 Tax=Fusarium sarcochroum TaxID=1208366 RepID=A0A8H4X9Y2_9HYPO|nr:hypothetical protein FSARC_5918 [Fusarium sarcochroum]
MNKELQELRSQNQRVEDHPTSRTDSTTDSGPSTVEDDGMDDFAFSSFPLSLDGVLVDSSVVTEAFTIFAELMRPRLPVVGSLSAQLAYEKEPLLFWTIVIIVLCRLPEQHSIALFKLLRAPYEKLLQSTVFFAPLPLYVVQALLLLCNWPLPCDRQSEDPSWLYCGVAIQAARYLSLDRQQTIPSLRVIGVNPGSIRARINTWLVCFSVATSLSLHLGLPCPIDSELDFSSIHAFLKRNTVSPAFALEVRIQIIVAKFTALLNHELADGTSSTFLRLLDSELDVLKTEMPSDDEQRSIVEFAILDAKIHMYALVITKFSSKSSSRQILLRNARDIALRIVHIGTSAICSSDTGDLTATRREKCQPKDRHRCLAFSNIFLLKFFFRNSSESPEDKQVVASSIARIGVLCKACTFDENDEFGRIQKTFEVLGRESPKDAEKPKLLLKHRMGVSLIYDAISHAGQVRGRSIELKEGETDHEEKPVEDTSQMQQFPSESYLIDQLDANPDFYKSFWNDPYMSLLSFDPSSTETNHQNTW